MSRELSYRNLEIPFIYGLGSDPLFLGTAGVPEFASQGDVYIGGYLEVFGIQFSLSGDHVHSEGLLHWSDDDKTLEIDTEVDGTSLQIGQESYIRVINKTGIEITNGQIVYINGAQGNRPTVALAKADSDVTAESTIGVATHTILDSKVGYITTQGLVRGLDTSACVEGDPIYLSPTVAGAFTKDKPAAPDHSIRIGFVTWDNDEEGIILVSIHNGYDLKNLHDVYVNGVQDDDFLKYIDANDRWENVTHLAVDDHTQYALLAGRSGGQVLYGGIASGENLVLSSTDDAVKGSIITDSLITDDGSGPLQLGTDGVASYVDSGDVFIGGELEVHPRMDLREWLQDGN